MTTLIKGGRVLDPATKTDKVMDILIKDGIVAERGENLDAVADEISHNLENLVGVPEEPAKADPVPDKFSDLSKHFGSDYNPTAK